ncbi:MAG TPA: hypothetical protein VLW65_02000 [Bryobacteraceae bacterium]|nr:hypothetical protein [Bryobacteraceae bacterium]
MEESYELRAVSFELNRPASLPNQELAFLIVDEATRREDLLSL